MKQLDLFQKNVTIRPKKAVKETKYNHLPDYSAPGKLTPTRELRSTRIQCRCKQAVKIYYDFVEPKERTGPYWDHWGKLSYNQFEQKPDWCFCPGCGVKLYIMNAKIRLIEVN